MSALSQTLSWRPVRPKFLGREGLIVDALGSSSVEVWNLGAVAATARPIDFIPDSGRSFLAVALGILAYFCWESMARKGERNLRRQTRFSEDREAYWKRAEETCPGDSVKMPMVMA
jgi:hypothetical protein